jgi:ribosome-associated toxin RatA of RatAB toxin-antitoxin module
MYSFRKTEDLEIPLAVAYQVAADIEKYHEFIHGMKSVNVLSKGNDHITVAFSSRLLGGRVQMSAQSKRNKSIYFRQDNGPFKKFSGCWIFREDDGKLLVTFAMEMKHNNLIINKTLQALGDKLCERIIKDFKKRAEEIIQQSAVNNQPSAKTND